MIDSITLNDASSSSSVIVNSISEYFYEGNLEALNNVIVANNIDILTYRDDEGDSLFSQYLESGKIELLEYLLSAFTSADCWLNNEEAILGLRDRAIWWACSNSALELYGTAPLNFLLGINPSKYAFLADMDGMTPLHAAAFSGYVEAVDSILTAISTLKELNLKLNSTDLIEAVDYESQNAIHYACRRGHLAVLERLSLPDGIPHWRPCWSAISRYYGTPLHAAVQSDSVETVRYLLDVVGVDINILDSDHLTAVWSVCQYSTVDISMLTYLLAAGADINERSQSGQSLLEWIDMRMRSESYIPGNLHEVDILPQYNIIQKRKQLKRERKRKTGLW